jgi:hypothetical protein
MNMGNIPQNYVMNLNNVMHIALINYVYDINFVKLVSKLGIFWPQVKQSPHNRFSDHFFMVSLHGQTPMLQFLKKI